MGGGARGGGHESAVMGWVGVMMSSEAPRGPGGSHAFAAFSTPGGFLVALAWRQARERGILDVWIPDLTLTSLLAMRGRERGARSEGEHRTRHSHTHNHTHRQTRL